MGDSLNFMYTNGKIRSHPARCAALSPGAKALEKTDKIKSCDSPLFSAKMFIATKENAPFLNGASVCKIK